MDIVNIYGHLDNKSKIVIGVGNYNNIHGLACYSTTDNSLQIRSLPEVTAMSALELTLNYEQMVGDALCFSISFGDKFIGVKIVDDAATAIVCSHKTLFTIDYSIVDNVPRSQLLAGSLYCLATEVNGKKYIVSWEINGFSNGDLVLFLPTTWYESVNGSICVPKHGVVNLLNVLNQLQFKGYTSETWCSKSNGVSNCQDGVYCGDCMGKCKNANQICYPNGDKFICGVPSNEPNMTIPNTITMANQQTTTTTSTTGMGTAATWVAIVIILMLIIVLAFVFGRGYYGY